MAYDNAFEAELCAQKIRQNSTAGAQRAAFPFGIAVHHGADAAFADGGLKRFSEHLT